MRYNLFRRVLPLLGLCLLLSFRGQSQSEGAKALAQSVSTYSQLHLQEKVYLHTDRSSYLAGETMWFKVYKVDAMHHQPVELSKVVYVELLNNEQVPMAQAKIDVEAGTGNGYLELPTSLNSGNYVLRAYTNWMKNAGEGFFFEKPLSIVNTFKKLNAQKVEPSVEYDIQFFPEGGQLVNGLQSKVAFKAVDKTGQGGSFVGTVIDQKNDTVARFYTYKFGIGSFLFTPASGSTYRAIFKGPNGQIFTRSLPTAQEIGTVMQVTNTEPEQVRVNVQTKGTGTQRVYLLVHSRQDAKLAQAASVDANGQAVFTLAKEILGEGISHFTVFNDQRQPVSERLYFKRPQQQTFHLKATTAQRQYSPRTEVNVEVQAQDFKGAPALANLSMAVYRLDSLQTPEAEDILSYLFLSSDLKGQVENPQYYVSSPSLDVETATDNLMLTHGWRRFTWQDVLQPSFAQVAHLPEIGGHLVLAKVMNRQTGQPAQNVLTYLSAPSLKVALYGSRSDANGRVLYDVKDFYGTRDLVLQTDTRQDSTYQFEIIDPFSTEPPVLRPQPLQFQPSLLHKLGSNNIHLQVQSYHTPPSAYSFTGPVLDSVAFYGQPDRQFLLDEFTRFPLVEDVLREYVPNVQVRKRGKRFQFAVVDQFRKESYREEPLVLLDGVPIFNTDSIMTYDPKNIRKLDVVARKYYLGPMAFHGIVSFSTYAGNLKGFPVDPRALLVEYQGLQMHREFYSPVYETQEQQNSRIPDLRTLLHWEPYVQTGDDGKKQVRFFSSDQKGRYQVVLQGITNDGKAGSATYQFSVQ
ncbi:hypothetical protein [Rufibacter roseus]|uniref:Macroglobulin domain-containing protein n=1 Tax=Rufibacter roseus TaxID=1567108 RepID=A0ABW2DHK4_9BACT|nr:hypothetical protein [Rufibacter roseus]